jgi:hypothetical protein
LKLKKPYRVVSQMKAIDERFPGQLKFWRYDVIWWRRNVKTDFYLKNEFFSFPSKDNHR